MMDPHRVVALSGADDIDNRLDEGFHFDLHPGDGLIEDGGGDFSKYAHEVLCVDLAGYRRWLWQEHKVSFDPLSLS